MVSDCCDSEEDVVAIEVTGEDLPVAGSLALDESMMTDRSTVCPEVPGLTGDNSMRTAEQSRHEMDVGVKFTDLMTKYAVLFNLFFNHFICC